MSDISQVLSQICQSIHVWLKDYRILLPQAIRGVSFSKFFRLSFSGGWPNEKTSVGEVVLIFVYAVFLVQFSIALGVLCAIIVLVFHVGSSVLLLPTGIYVLAVLMQSRCFSWFSFYRLKLLRLIEAVDEDVPPEEFLTKQRRLFPE